MTIRSRLRVGILVLSSLGAASVALAQTPPVPSPRPAPENGPGLGARVEIEPAALDLVKAMSAKLAAARTMTFTAVATYESADRTGEPLAYSTLSEVTLQRPDRLRVLTLGDGPPSEFTFDGKTVAAYEPQAKLVAVAEVPGTVDQMLKGAFDNAAIYFPFTDVIVADPLKGFTDGLVMAFMIGKSVVVGGVPTDIVALVTDTVHAQIWVGSDDKLPRMIRATFVDDPGHYRHVVEFRDWKLDPVIPEDVFSSAAAVGAIHVPFARPDAPVVSPVKR